MLAAGSGRPSSGPAGVCQADEKAPPEHTRQQLTAGPAHPTTGHRRKDWTILPQVTVVTNQAGSPRCIPVASSP